MCARFGQSIVSGPDLTTVSEPLAKQILIVEVFSRGVDNALRTNQSVSPMLRSIENRLAVDAEYESLVT